jgi:hypothetical protein
LLKNFLRIRNVELDPEEVFQLFAVESAQENLVEAVQVFPVRGLGGHRYRPFAQTGRSPRLLVSSKRRCPVNLLSCQIDAGRPKRRLSHVSTPLQNAVTHPRPFGDLSSRWEKLTNASYL